MKKFEPKSSNSTANVNKSQTLPKTGSIIQVLTATETNVWQIVCRFHRQNNACTSSIAMSKEKLRNSHEFDDLLKDELHTIVSECFKVPNLLLSSLSADQNFTAKLAASRNPTETLISSLLALTPY